VVVISAFSWALLKWSGTVGLDDRGAVVAVVRFGQ
jgi:hypothetical protein